MRAMVRATPFVLLCMLAACNPPTERPVTVLRAQMDPSRTSNLENDLSRFALDNELSLRSATFEADLGTEHAFQMTGSGVDIVLRSPFKEGEYSAYFYTKGSGGDREKVFRLAERFSTEVEPRNWRRDQ